MRQSRLVAVGDSVSEGVGDPGPGALRGWIHYLAADPGLFLVANLARAGSVVADVRRRQLDRALALRPDVVTCVIGVNDVMGRGFDPDAFERDHDHVVGALRAAGAGVLTMTLHDIGAGLPVPRGRLTGLRQRIEQANEVVERVTERHGAWLLDARDVPPMSATGMISIDRLHPNPRGHRFLAAHALDVLRDRGVVADGPRAAVPPADPVRRRLTSAARHLLWLGQHVTSPVRRS
jgi:lysophospholipase L1-like esterase